MLDERKLNEIMQLYTEDLIRMSYYYTHNLHTAQDIVQEVFIRFYKKQIELERTKIKPYLTKMVVNQSKDYLKSFYFRKTKFVESFKSKESSLDRNQFLLKDEEDEISEAIFALPIKNREVITYYYFENMPIKDISNLLKIPESTLKSRLAKGKVLLKDKLKLVDWEEIFNG